MEVKTVAISDAALKASPELGITDLAIRIRDYGRENQAFLNSMLMSVVVANAAYTLALLIASGITPRLWAPFWVAGFLMVIVTFAGIFASNLLVAYVPDWRDTLIPLSQTVVGFLMFSVLTPVGSNLPMLTDWYLVVAAISLLAVAGMSNGISKISQTAYDPPLKDLAKRFAESVSFKRVFPSVNCVVWVVIWAFVRFLMPYHPALAAYQALLPFVLMMVAVGALVGFESDRKMIIENVRSYTLSSRSNLVRD
jgi:hypothetical protein